MTGLSTARRAPGLRGGRARRQPGARGRDLQLRFGGVRALRGVSFDVNQDELLAVIGPNGAGKSTIFNCLSGVYRPQEGAIRFLGASSPAPRPRRSRARAWRAPSRTSRSSRRSACSTTCMLGRHLHIGYGPFAAMLWLGRARREELRSGGWWRRSSSSSSSARTQAPRWAPALRREEARGARPGHRHGAQVAADGRAGGGMNAEETEELAAAIVAIRDELHIPIVLVEHDMALVMGLADRVLVLDFGAQVALGAPEEVQRDPDVIRAYLGEEHEGRPRDGRVARRVAERSPRGSVRGPPARPDAVALREKRLGHLAGDHLGRLRGARELAAHAPVALGVEPGDRVAVHSENRPEWLVADVGDGGARAVTVGVYPTNPAAEVELPAGGLGRPGPGGRGPGAGGQGARGEGTCRTRVDRLHRAARGQRLRRPRR